MSLARKKILVTGCAGFIGAALVSKLLDSNANVVGIDNINSYYCQKLKFARLEEIKKKKDKSKGSWNFFKLSLEDSESFKKIYLKHDFDVVVHLAAQAGVRYSLINPEAYINSNLVGFGNVLEMCRKKNTKNFIFASSSSVYGGNEKVPFKESDNVDHPVSFYAATKKANELMAHSYSHLYQIPTTGLRFFTVYGPWGRPDMAPIIFAKSIFKKEKIQIFNKGNMFRDFTYIDDIVTGIYKCCYKNAIQEDSESLSSNAPYKIFNIGNGHPIKLMRFISLLEKEIGIEAKKEFIDMQPGDVVETWSDSSSLKEWIGYHPTTPIEIGIRKFVKWYKDYYQ